MRLAKIKFNENGYIEHVNRMETKIMFCGRR